jgi:adenosylcobinamide-phosphate synthase
MVGEVDLLAAFRPDAGALALAILLDLALGDPQYRLHPVRLMGDSIAAAERGLRALGWDALGGGAVLGLAVPAAWCAGVVALVSALSSLHPALSFAFHAFVAYSLLALRSLLDHAWAVESALRRGDLVGARRSTSMFVSRDTDMLDAAGCRRASIESVSESLTDGYVSALFWYAVAGLPGLVVFKVYSTLDSMVGYRNERYLHFGRFSARMDDGLNWLPARLAWILISLCSAVLPGCSARSAIRVGWSQHALVPGPNSGWSEAATAGAIGRRLVGPIVSGGRRVTEIWLGDPNAPPAGEDPEDLPRAMLLCAAAGLAAGLLALAASVSR